MGEKNTDLKLVQKAQAGDNRAFDLLVLKYESRIANVISKLVWNQEDVLDVSQEAFIKAYRALPNFRGDSAFYTWIYRIAINTAKNFLVAKGVKGAGEGGNDDKGAFRCDLRAVGIGDGRFDGGEILVQAGRDQQII